MRSGLKRDHYFRFTFFLATLGFIQISSSLLLCQNHPPDLRRLNTLPNKERIQSVSQRFSGGFKSREDHGPFSKIVFSNDLTLIVKEHHATPLVALTVLVKLPNLPPSEESELLLRLVAFKIFPFEPGSSITVGESSIKNLGGLASIKITPDFLEWTVALPAENLPRAYPLLLRGITAAELDKSTWVEDLKNWSSAAGPASASPDRELFVLAGYPSTFRPPADVSPSFYEKLQQFLKHNLVAPQIVLTVVGDVDREVVIRQVGTTFANLPTGQPRAQPSPPLQPREVGFEYKILPAVNGQAELGVYFPSTSVSAATLSTLSGLLVLGEMSALGQTLISRRGVVASLWAEENVVIGQNYFSVHLRCPRENLDEASVYLFARLRQFSGMTPTEDEILRARKQYVLAWHLDNRSAISISQRLAEYEAVGGSSFYVRTLTDLEKVTVAEVKKAASDLFTLDHATVIEHWPSGNGIAARTFTTETYRDFIALALPRAITKLGKKTEQSGTNLRPIKASPSPYVGNFDRTQLKASTWNRYSILRGPAVYVNEFHLSPLVAILALYPGGKMFESVEHVGMTALTVRSAIQSIKSRTHDELWFELEASGATLLPLVQDDLFGYVLISPPSSATAGIDILLEILLEPQFSPDDIAFAKAQVMNQLRSGLESAPDFANDRIKSVFFSHTNLYQSMSQQVSQIRRATEKNVADWWNHLQKDIPPTLVILGDTEGTELVAPFARKLSSSKWRSATPVSLDSIKTPTRPFLIQDSFEGIDEPQMTFGFAGPSLAAANTDAIQVGQQLFSTLFGKSAVDEFYYLRFFVGTSGDVKGSALNFSSYIAKQMEALVANDAAVSNSQKVLRTQRILEDLDPIANGLNFYRRSLYAQDVDSVSKSEQMIFQMPVSQLREVLASVFNSQNMIRCILTPMAPK